MSSNNRKDQSNNLQSNHLFFAETKNHTTPSVRSKHFFKDNLLSSSTSTVSPTLRMIKFSPRKATFSKKSRNEIQSHEKQREHQDNDELLEEHYTFGTYDVIHRRKKHKSKEISRDYSMKNGHSNNHNSYSNNGNNDNYDNNKNNFRGLPFKVDKEVEREMMKEVAPGPLLMSSTGWIPLNGGDSVEKTVWIQKDSVRRL